MKSIRVYSNDVEKPRREVMLKANILVGEKAKEKFPSQTFFPKAPEKKDKPKTDG